MGRLLGLGLVSSIKNVTHCDTGVLKKCRFYDYYKRADCWALFAFFYYYILLSVMAAHGWHRGQKNIINVFYF